MKYLLTGMIVLTAVVAILLKYWDYVINPWTRDGQVRAEIVQITPRVSGPIIKLEVKDNQFVKTGDLLFEIDPRTFKASLFQAQAEYDKSIDNYHALEKQVEATQAQVEVAKASVGQAQSSIKQTDAEIEKNKAEFERQKELLPKHATSQKSVDRARASYEVSTEQRKVNLASLIQARASLSQSEANLAKAKADLGAPGDNNPSIRAAKAALEQAQLNLEFTQVKATVDGYITNLNLLIGSQAVANQSMLALVDVHSFWIDGFFKETYLSKIEKGNKATVILMTYQNKPIDGLVESIGWGVAQDDGSTGEQLLPNINPTFEWIRLAQRLPVSIKLGKLPEGVKLRVGSTASVLVYSGSSSKGSSSKGSSRKDSTTTGEMK
jgi:multidrug resistance efflux pump